MNDRVLVVGGGLAGVAAATVLAEHGAKVTLVERETYLGGRVGAWSDTLSSGESFQMERGFHAFFRQYYNLRALLRRVDPALSFLTPVVDYPLLGPHGARESFADLPKRAPLNIAALVRRTRTLSLTDLARVNVRSALEMLRFEMERTYARFDHMTAKEYLDSLHFPDDARRMLFDVFAHSFFNPEEEMSAAELLMMFHFYFTGNPEGLLFDVMKEPFSTAFFEPMVRYLQRHAVRFNLGAEVTRIDRSHNKFTVALSTGETLRDFDHAVMAVSVPALKTLLLNADAFDDRELAQSIRSLDVTSPFAVWRVWLDRPTATNREPFVGTAGFGIVDNISLYHLFEGESARWAARTNGSVVEVHAYAVSDALDEAAIKAEFRRVLHETHPELEGARELDERFLLRRDCPAFRPGSFSRRPSVKTSVAGLYLAGDFVKLPFPSALMERAATSGMIAANHVLESQGVRGVDVRHAPSRGVFNLRLPRSANMRSA